MCGIGGVLAFDHGQSPVDPNILLRINQIQAVRGPDGAGIWRSEDGRVGLAHRRLALVGLGPGGAQPMLSANGRIALVFNGEIYNHIALRRELEAEGVVFSGSSDTEVILHLYRRLGPAFLERLVGMFALALWDEAAGGLLLARDGFGIKPLYYSKTPEGLSFASQVRALKATTPAATIDPAAVVGFLMLGSVPEPFTWWREITCLPAGTALWITRNGAEKTWRHFDPRTAVLTAPSPASPAPPGARLDHLRHALSASLRRHGDADVPVGLFLSAGVDSAAMAALAATSGHAAMETLTLSFDCLAGHPADEAPAAAALARRYGLPHRTARVDDTRTDDKSFDGILTAVLDAMDQPTIDGVNMWLVARAAAAAGWKAAISGVGGDEIFMGYPSFRQIARLRPFMPLLRGLSGAGPIVRDGLAPLCRALGRPKWAGLVEWGGSIADAYLLRRALFMPWELPGLIGTDTAAAGLVRLDLGTRLAATIDGVDDPLRAVGLLETCWYMRNQLLRDADWAGMAHGVEIRTPLVDTAFYGEIIGLAPMPDKALLAAAAGLPPDYAATPKRGFAVPGLEGQAGMPGRRGWALRVLGHFGFPAGSI